MSVRRRIRRYLYELLRRVLVWLRCRGEWCQACQLDSHSVAHTCPQRASRALYIDGEGRRVEFGRIVGAEEGLPKRKAVVRGYRTRSRTLPFAQKKSLT